MTAQASETIRYHAAFIWSVADLLRGDYRQSEYGRVILPLVVLRRLDCVLEPTKDQVLAKVEQLAGRVGNVEPLLRRAAGQQFYNVSRLTMRKLLDDPNHLADNLRSYVLDFSPAATDVLQKFDLLTQIERLDRADLLFLVVSRFCDIDLHPDQVSNLEMGYLYEELIRRFSELSNETAGEHFTPREVIRLMLNLLFLEDDELLTRPGVVKSMLDPACGTGGMLSVAEDHLRSLHPEARLEVFGQELNPESYAICRSDMMLKGQTADNIVLGNSFSGGRLPRGPVRLPAGEPAVRGGVEEGRAGSPRRARIQGFRRAVPSWVAPHQRRVVPVSAAHDRPHEAACVRRVGAGRIATGHRLQRLPAVYRRGRIGRVRDPALDHRERLAGSRRRAARPALLQHRHLHLLLDRHQP